MIRSRLLLLASSLVLLSSCAESGWVPFLWADYGRGDGFTEGLWQKPDADVGDLDRWSAGIGFAYGGGLPGLMTPRSSPPLRPLSLEDLGLKPKPEPDLHTEVWHFMDWFAKLGPWALGALCLLVIGLAITFRERIKSWIPKFGNNNKDNKK